MARSHEVHATAEQGIGLWLGCRCPARCAMRRSHSGARPRARGPRTWPAVIEQLGARKLVVGGKSQGGRIVGLVADVAGLLCLGYPFHPAGSGVALGICFRLLKH